MPAHRLWMKSGASGRAINFQHPAIHQNENDNSHRLHREANERRLQ